MSYYVHRFGCFGASCSDLWPDDNPTSQGPAFPPPVPTSVGVNVSVPAQSALLAPAPMPEGGHFLPWWLWFGIGLLVALAVKE